MPTQISEIASEYVKLQKQGDKINLRDLKRFVQEEVFVEKRRGDVVPSSALLLTRRGVKLDSKEPNYVSVEV